MKNILVILVYSMLSFQLCYSQENITLAQADDITSRISFSVLKEAYAKLGKELSTETLPAARALSESNSGFLDGEVNRIKKVTEKYSNLVIIPTQINHIEGVIFSKKYDFPIQNRKSIEPYIIGIRTGTKFAEALTDGMIRELTATNEQVFKMLLDDRVELVLIAKMEGLAQLHKLGESEIKILQPPLIELPLYHFLHKKHLDLVPKINEILIEMKKNGRIDEIREKYITEIFKQNN